MNKHSLNPMRVLAVCALSVGLASPAFAREGANEPVANPAAPMVFIQNAGQVKDQFGQNRADVDFKISAPGMGLFIGDGAMHYMWYKEVSQYPAPAVTGVHSKDRSILGYNTADKVETYRLDVTLIGANKNAATVVEDSKEYTERFYLSNVAPGAVAQSYGKITYKNVYPNIDWVVYSKDNHVKYDFVVHPGGNPADIKLRYDGATAFNTENGAVTVTTPMGNVTEQKPYSYDAATGREIASAFVLSGNVLSFSTASHTGTMVIDPTINWGTYYGASMGEAVNGMATDASGNIWMALGTTSSNNIVSVGAHQNFLSGALDGMLVRSNASGNIQAATYYGGPDLDRFNAIAVDGSGNVYCAGPTSSNSGIATVGSAQPVLGGTTTVNEFADGFVVKFNSASVLQWGTYYGGNQTDVITAISVDASGNVYACGTTKSGSAIATAGTFQTGVYSGQDGFIVKLLQSNGTRVWGTYYGGEDNDELHSVVPDATGTGIYVCGWTGSLNNIATVGAHQQNNPDAGVTVSGYFAKFNTNGTLAFGTFYGGYGEDVLYRIAVDGNNVYTAGHSESTTDISTANAFQPSPVSQSDCIFVKFSNTGVRQWGTYFGGYNIESVRSIYTNAKGYLHFGGFSNSTNLATTGAYNVSGGGNGYNEGIWGQFSPAGQLTYCSYYGGNDETQVSATCAGLNGEILLAGYSKSTVGIATAGGWQNFNGGNEDAFLVNFKADTLVYVVNPLNSSFCGNETFNLYYTVNNLFKTGNTFTAQLSDALGNFASPTNIGSVAATNDGTISCTIPATVLTGTKYRVRILASNPVCTSAVHYADITLNPVVTPTVQIVVSPGTTVGPYKSVSMTVNATDGGLNPTFQWKKNGQPIPGATTAFLTLVAGVDFISGDQVTVDMVSNKPCANPTNVSSTATTLTIGLGVGDVTGGNAVRIYPNPTNGSFTVSGLGSLKAGHLTITDVMGKVVYSSKTGNADALSISLPASLPNGLYLLKVQTAIGELQSKLSLQR